MEILKENLLKVHERINNACNRVGRNPEEVRLLLATKTVEPAVILNAFSLGENLIGENRAQELVAKHDALKNVKHECHFIGALQSNKIKSIIDKVSCIESIYRLSIAEKINKRLVKNNMTMDILLEVNTSNEKSKDGCNPEELLELAGNISELPAIRIRGLMTIGALSEDKKKVRSCFTMLKDLSEKLKSQNLKNVRMDILSMGMSNDFEIAIEEGSTEIRLGSLIFGERKY